MDIKERLENFGKFKEDLEKSGVEPGTKAYEEACEEYMGIASSSSSSSSEDEDFKKIGKDIDNIGGQNNQPSQERK